MAIMSSFQPQLEQTLLDSLILRADRVAFAQKAGLDPYPWQIRLLQDESRNIVLNCSRQSGKSTVTAMLALHQAFCIPKSLVLLLAASERQSILLLDKIKSGLRTLGWQPQRGERDNVGSIKFANGSKIIALPAKDGSIRGFSSVSLVIIDEASRVMDELYYAVRPMLAASRGRLVVLSTPFGKRGFFYEIWTTGGREWSKYEVRAAEIPHIDPAFLAAECEALPSEWYAQEYECQFVDSTGTLFTAELIDQMLRDDIPALFPQSQSTASWQDAILPVVEFPELPLRVPRGAVSEDGASQVF